jgi:hypothetical protein
MPKVYVGNLAGSVTRRDLITHFAHVGEVLGAGGYRQGFRSLAAASALWRRRLVRKSDEP